jgi:hypothetical protein
MPTEQELAIAKQEKITSLNARYLIAKTAHIKATSACEAADLARAEALNKLRAAAVELEDLDKQLIALHK